MPSLRIRNVPGMAHVDWENTRPNSGDFWIVALGNTPDSKPRLFRLGSSGQFAELDDVPFNSVVVTRYKQVQQEKRWRIWRIVAEALAVSALVSVVVATLLGFIQFRTVVSGSMSGTFEVGDVLVAVSPRLAPPEVGSIAVFHYYSVDRSYFVADFSHRIIGGSAAEGWTTKGDANQSADLGTVLSHDISGVVLFWIPKLGFALQPQFVLGIVILVMLAVTIGPDIRDFVRQRKKQWSAS